MKNTILQKSTFFGLILTIIPLGLFCQETSLVTNEDGKIPTMIALKKSLEKENKLSTGYTIQLYYGELTKADEILKEYKNNYNSWPASIEYETPNYKVWVGNYSNRLEADRARLEIAKKFPTAFILKADRS